MNRTMQLEVMRAEAEWQRAGAYSVRIQGMNRQHHLSLREEFDEYDADGTKYIILLDGGYPIATCRFYEIAPDAVTLGRVVVLASKLQNYFSTSMMSAGVWMKYSGWSSVLSDTARSGAPSSSHSTLYVRVHMTSAKSTPALWAVSRSYSASPM